MASHKRLLADAAFGVVVLAGVIKGSEPVRGDDDGNGDQPTDVEFVIQSASTVGIDYEVNVDSEPQRVMRGSNDEAEDSDQIVQRPDGTWDIRGTTGSAAGNEAYGDTFEWTTSGSNAGILGFNASLSVTEYTVLINGDEIEPGSLPDYTPPDDDDGNGGNGGIPLGGGAGYGRTVSPSQADYTAASAGELADGLSAASSGDVVYATQGFDLGGGGYVVPSGVTLAGDRGIDGSPGPLLTESGHPVGAIVGDGGRITGIRIRGPHHDEVGHGADNGRASGVHLVGGSEIDNCDIYGFDLASVYAQGSGGGGHVHHNHLHDTNASGLGYGVVVYGASSDPTIEKNYLWMCRHAVAAAGSDGGGYTCRDNHFGPSPSGHAGNHVIDAHADNPRSFHIARNIVEETSVESVNTHNNDATIQDNWFFLTSPEDVFEDNTTDHATISGNFYGPGAASPEEIISGHPGHAPW